MKADLPQLQDIFLQMAIDGFDTNNSLKWGFYFVHSNKVQLVELYAELIDHNYVMEELRLDEEKDWWLHVSKIDTLTPEKLHKRNLAFNELASGCGVELYDGWDVERLGSN